MDQSLTSLREEPIKTSEENPVLISPQDKEALKLVNVKSEITLLIKKRDALQEDIENLSKTSEKTRFQLSGEIRPLRKRKRVLLKQVDELLKAVGIMKGTRKGMVSAFEKFGSERADALWGISRAFNLDIADRTQRLLKKSKEAFQLEGFLEQLANYYTKLGTIVEAEIAQNQQREVELVERGRGAKKLDKIIAERAKKAQEMMIKATGKLSSVDRKYEKADKLVKFFENEADKEKGRLEVWAKTVGLREKKVAAKKREFKGLEEELDNREGWLDDREKTLGRTISKLRKAGYDILL